VPKYNLTSPEAIAVSAKIASDHADRQPNQSSYNAAWMHGYAEALKDVARQLSLDKAKNTPAQLPSEPQKNMLKLWARVGMTIHVSKDTYEQLLQTDRGDLLQEIITGKHGKAYLDGETYFPDIEENLDLVEREYHLYDSNPISSSKYSRQSNPRGDLNNIIQNATERSSNVSALDKNQKKNEDRHEI